MTMQDIDDIDKLRKIAQVLMERVESDTNHQGNHFSLFRTAVGLEEQVKRRTDELTATLNRVERINRELEVAKEAAEDANRSKTRFLAAASHDLLQPINALNLSVSLLKDNAAGSGLETLVDQIERSVTSMDSLLRALLDLSKYDAGAIPVTREPCHLPGLIGKVVGAMAPHAEGKGLKLRHRVREISVLSDSSILERILMNLLSNAVRYTSSGGVFVGTRFVGEHVAIDIHDTGCGISEREMPLIFDEFHRAKGNNVREIGHGLGLSIVKRMCDALGYRILVHSVPGRGSRFRILIPQSGIVEHAEAAALPKQQKAASGGPAKLNKAKVLILENDADVLVAISGVVASWGAQAHSAASVRDTVRLLLDLKFVPDLIIADQNLDEKDLGTDAVVTLRSLLDRTTPAIIVTADPSEDNRRRTKEIGAELLAKPVRPAQLRALSSHLISQSEKLRRK